jgi:hypothetical protein
MQMLVWEKRYETETIARVIWLYLKGPIPSNLWILHKCDNGRCANPDHLFLGNQSDNMKDAYKKRSNSASI